MPLIGVAIFSWLGLYRAVIRFIGDEVVWSIVKGVLLLTLSMYVLVALSGTYGFPRSIPINFAIISTLYVAGSRFLIKLYYLSYIRNQPGKTRVLVYGAGDAGTQFTQTLRNSREFNPVAFIDDDCSLQGQVINGLPVYAPQEVSSVIRRFSITRVILAIPAASSERQRKIIDALRGLHVHVQTLPTLGELASGTSSFSNLREIELDNLLGRDVVAPNQELLEKSITGKVIMVTGAGGSIGSELCRQIYKLSPSRLILYDNSEFSLYTICNELAGLADSNSGLSCHVECVLGSVLDSVHLEKVVSEFKVQNIFHAAAYKHVPMVEENRLEGVRNNLLGTKYVGEVAIKCNVERFILVSTDKAVRPTSVMGATKRAAEQVIQCFAEKQSKTIFSIVRFGNVLGSSGSVVPLFRKQISEGGPVTVTHKDITRYFMSIPEAAQLVIQAGAMASGGEVFVLDMKSPVKIYDLARNMIELSGYSVRDEGNPDGDIEIRYIGLRPGEKLYEELFISDSMEKTSHPQIMRSNELYLGEDILMSIIDEMDELISAYNEDGVVLKLKQIVREYMPCDAG